MDQIQLSRISTMHQLADLDTYHPPAWYALCRLLNDRLLAATSLEEAQAIWRQKLRCRAVYDASLDPDQTARNLLSLFAQRQMAA
jgi:hypothetical protein